MTTPHADQDGSEPRPSSVTRLEAFIEMLPPAVGHNLRHFRADIGYHLTGEGCPCVPERVAHEPGRRGNSATYVIHDETTTATRAQVEAAMAAEHCHPYRGEECTSHVRAQWTERGCRVAVAMADAVVAASGVPGSNPLHEAPDRDAEHTVPANDAHAILAFVADRMDEFAYSEVSTAIENLLDRIQAADAEQKRLRKALKGANGWAESQRLAKLGAERALAEQRAKGCRDVAEVLRGRAAYDGELAAARVELTNLALWADECAAALAGPEPETTEGGDD